MTEWDRCKPWIEAALEYAGGTHTIEDVERNVLSGRMALIARERSAYVVELITYPRLKTLHVFLSGGDLDDIKAFDPQMDAIARSLGCSRITIAGRRGFARALKGLGYVEKWSVLAKEIGNE